MPRINLILDDELHAWLKKHSSEQRLSAVAYIRTLIVADMRDKEPPAPKTLKPSKPHTPHHSSHAYDPFPPTPDPKPTPNYIDPAKLTAKLEALRPRQVRLWRVQAEMEAAHKLGAAIQHARDAIASGDLIAARDTLDNTEIRLGVVEDRLRSQGIDPDTLPDPTGWRETLDELQELDE